MLKETLNTIQPSRDSVNKSISQAKLVKRFFVHMKVFLE